MIGAVLCLALGAANIAFFAANGSPFNLGVGIFSVLIGLATWPERA